MSSSARLILYISRIYGVNKTGGFTNNLLPAFPLQNSIKSEHINFEYKNEILKKIADPVQQLVFD